MAGFNFPWECLQSRDCLTIILEFGSKRKALLSESVYTLSSRGRPPRLQKTCKLEPPWLLIHYSGRFQPDTGVTPITIQTFIWMIKTKIWPDTGVTRFTVTACFLELQNRILTGYKHDPDHAQNCFLLIKSSFDRDPERVLDLVKMVFEQGKADLAVIRITPVCGPNSILKLRKIRFDRKAGHACIRSKFDFEAPKSMLLPWSGSRLYPV